MLAMSIAGSATAGGSGMLCDFGHFDGRQFMVTEPTLQTKWVDHGADFFAAQTFTSTPRRRRVWLGWMSNWRYAGLTPTEPWRGCMSLPREISLVRRNGKLKLRQHPVTELDSLRGEPQRLDEGGSVHLGHPACDIVARFKPAKSGRTGIRLRSSSRAWTDIGYDSSYAMLYVDRRNSGQVDFHDLFGAVHTAPFRPGADGFVDLRIVVDSCSIEVFADDGTVVITDLIFPDSLDLLVEFHSTDEHRDLDATVHELVITEEGRDPS
jgi:fructan beta-fructosidase